jgi:2-keto-4-pentenoate hydratase/2-oxohepta-3-ene-1,7-dioic acid hydratase in catechol pathway
MKLCRFQPLEFGVDAVGAPARPEPLFGRVENGSVIELLGNPVTEMRSGERAWPLDRVRLLAPVVPGKIVAVGKNYRDHIAEMGIAPPADPVIFLKPPSSVIGPGDPIVLTPSSKRVDYEGELAIVIGRTCSQLAESTDLKPFILGYTCLNDVTARDLQKSDGQWTRAKGFDTFCPIGPVIETELDPDKCTIETFLNGERRQSALATDMIYPINFIIPWITRVMTLFPGDVVTTGTPAGVGPVLPGDIVEVVVGGVGTLRNPVIAPAV